MTAAAKRALEDFQWRPQPEAARLIEAWVEQFLAATPPAAELAQRMRDETGTRFGDWIDSIIVPDAPGLAARLAETGFAADPGEMSESTLALDANGGVATGTIWHHPGGMFPAVILAPRPTTEVLLKIESVPDFLAANPWSTPAAIEGAPLSPLRRARIASTPRMALWVIERHGYRGSIPHRADLTPLPLLQHSEAFRLRRRDWPDDQAGFDHVHGLILAAVRDLGPDRAADLFFSAERDYWQHRNRAAQVQKARQDRLGLGWANHDHHTYRSSRQHFARLITLFETLGLTCRERFYAGKEAGWGAQVMEQSRHVGSIVVFADVDLAPDELLDDFAHQPLPPRPRSADPRSAALGTVGLWCGLHGESILQAGMHHLECQFDFPALTRQLDSQAGIGMMPPFTDLPYLKQAFTVGERWSVAESRLAALLTQGSITPAQAERFARQGAIGSHLENLERRDGFKGFNQSGVSQIIAATDPRKHLPPDSPPAGA